jgi:hypothetical protein
MAVILFSLLPLNGYNPILISTLLNRGTFVSYLVPSLRQATPPVLRRKDPLTIGGYEERQEG